MDSSICRGWGVALRSAKELAQRVQGRAGRLFGKEMATRQGEPAHVGRVRPPHVERVVVASDKAVLTPQHQGRAVQLLAGLRGCRIVLEVNGGGGPIVRA
jgi:hypothetical protein